MIVKSYTISTAFTGGAVNTNALTYEIVESGSVTGFSGTGIEGDNLNIFGSALGSEEDLDTVISTHDAALAGIRDYVKKKIIDAMNFGQNLMAEYGAQNILTGLNTQQVKSIMATLSGVQQALLAGSLYVALEEISDITPDGTLITQATLDKFRNKIQDHLGIPRT